MCVSATSIVTLLRARSKRSPQAIALAWQSRSWSYGDLALVIDVIAARVAARGMRQGDRVALLMRNCPHYVALYYGVLSAGCVVVPLNVHERAEALLRAIVHSGAQLVFADPAHPEWPALQAGLSKAGVPASTVPVDDDAIKSAEEFRAALNEVGVDAPQFVAEPEDLACIIYTSGTTGQPKGVMLSHRNLAANAKSVIDSLGLTERDSVLSVLPFHFSYGNSVLHSHLICGARVVIEDSLAFPHIVLERIVEERATGFSGVPSTFALLLSRCSLAEFDLTSLRYITQAGGPMPRTLIARLRNELPTVSLFVMYGQTEAAARLTCLPPSRLEDKLGSVGVPIPMVEIAVKRPDGSNSTAGEVGEICARGPNVMLGYWRDRELTLAALRDGWLRTGDLGYLDGDGFLFLTGRSAEMIKVGAFRISPQEIEEVIAAIADVEEVAVVGIADEILGQVVKAVIVSRAGSALDAIRVKAHCRAALASYKIPRVVEFATSLPRTASGKVQRHKLV